MGLTVSKTQEMSYAEQSAISEGNVTLEDDPIPIPEGYLAAPKEGLLLSKQNCLYLNKLLIESKRIVHRNDASNPTNPTKTPSLWWSILYQSDYDGKSWSVFQSRIQAAEKCLLIFKDKSGAVFGGYVGQPLVASVQFQSNPDSFIISFKGDSCRTYFPTGINSNHIYFNQGSKTFPNGFGMGGQLDYFGFLVSIDFHGHSRGDPTSSTFGNPVLTQSSDGDFEIEACEAWGLEQRDKEGIEYLKSIRENLETVALLEMAGKEFYSHHV